jgi:hypothetical protein
MCDTDSFGSRLSSGNGVGVEYNSKHIKEEIENDEDYFQLLANQTRALRHLDGKFHKQQKNYDQKFFHEATAEKTERNSRLRTH